MSYIKLKSLKVKNYRSFGNIEQEFDFTKATEKNLPLAIVGYNNAGKTNLMNSILYTLQVNFVSKDTFSIDDFHYKNIENKPEIFLECESSQEIKFNGKEADLSGFHKLDIVIDGDEISGSGIKSFKLNGNDNFSAFGALRYYNVFNINFHKIKEEISTQKSSWGNLKSFLAKHIKKLVEEDDNMKARKGAFKDDVKNATDKVLNGEKGETKSQLIEFIEKIKNNYCINLRDNNCEVEFGLPDYEDIFLQMIFKIGLNGKADKLVPIDHFGDGYISMFVMAVIQAIAEEKGDNDKCLFLFEEPESFLHENHQEYFYKMVLCELAQKGHQVIYTTHSDKMVDITEPDSLIRLEFNGEQTVKTFPIPDRINPLEKPEDQEIIKQYNQYIKNIEPNLNKILFSERVLLVEGPNDLLVYNYLIKLKARAKADTEDNLKSKTSEERQKWAETYLNFNNIAIIPHHGKATAYILANLCQYLGVNYYLINDWDFDELDLKIDQIKNFTTEEDLKKDIIYTNQTDSNKKGMITTNWKLIKSAKDDQIHFNIKKLETIIDYKSDDKDAVKMWLAIKSKFSSKNENNEDIPDSNKITKNIFPYTLDNFLFPSKTQDSKKDEIILPNMQVPKVDISEFDISSMDVQMPF